MATIGRIFKEAFAALRQNGVVLNEKVSTMDGKELEIEMQGETIAVGDSVTMEGQPADGKFELADGTTIMVTEGKITEVEKAQAQAQAQANIMDATKADLQKQISDLTGQLNTALAEIESLKSENTQMVDEVEVITNHLRKLQVNVQLPRAVAQFNRLKTDNVHIEKTVEEEKARFKELQNKSRKKTTIAI